VPSGERGAEPFGQLLAGARAGGPLSRREAARAARAMSESVRYIDAPYQIMVRRSGSRFADEKRCGRRTKLEKLERIPIPTDRNSL
jgi:hypothetical protein